MARTIERTAYTAAELRDAHPRGFAAALARHQRWVGEDPAWAGEHRDSLQAILKAFGDDPPRIDRATHKEDVRRCMAWVENNIVAPLRVPYGPIAARKSTTRHGGDYRPGHVTPCPFTGYCVDDDLLDYVRNGARSGTSPYDLRREVEQESDRLWSAEVDSQSTADAFIDDAEANEREFYSDGGLAYGEGAR